MALTRVAAAGINTGQTFVLQNVNTSGIVTAGTVQVGSATTIHSTGIDLGSGNITSHNINSTGIITATGGFVGAVTGNVTGNLTGNVTGNVSSSGANTLGSLTVTNDATVGGALTITGDLTVNGTTTTIDTAVTAVDSLAIDGNAIIDGSIGIGTDNPTTKLVIAGDWVNSTGQLRIKPSSVGQTLSGFTLGTQNNTLLATTYSNSSTGNLYFQNNTESGNIIFTGPTTEHFRITSSGVKQVKNGNLNIYQTYIDFSGDQSSTPNTAVALYRPADNEFAISTGNVERLRITSSGSVGIGTTSPQAKLDVWGDVSITNQDGGIAFSDPDDKAEHHVLYMKSSDNSLNFKTYNGTDGWVDRVKLNTSGKLFVTGSGSDSVNTTTLPNGSTINVNGKSSNDGFSVIRYSASYGAYGLNIGRSKSDTLGTNAAVTNGNDLGHITFYGADGTDFNQAVQITAQVDGTPSDGTDMPGRLLFRTSPATSATPETRVCIDSSGRFLHGTGTTALDSAAAAFGRTGSSGADNTDGIEKGLILRYDNGPSNIDLNGTDNYHLLVQNAAYAGTGVADPQGSIAKILFKGTTYNGWVSHGYIALDTQGASGNKGDLVFGTGNPAERMRIQSNGTIGINTTTVAESAQVQIRGASDGVLNLDTTDGRGSFIRFKENGTTKAWVGCSEGMGTGGDQDDLGLRAVDNIYFRAGTSNKVSITSSGTLQVSNGDTGNDSAVNILKSSGDNADQAILRVGYDTSNCLEIYRERGSSSIYLNTTQANIETRIRHLDKDVATISDRGALAVGKLIPKVVHYGVSNFDGNFSPETPVRFYLYYSAGSSSATHHFARMISQPDWSFTKWSVRQIKTQYTATNDDLATWDNYGSYSNHNFYVSNYNQQGSTSGGGNWNVIGRNQNLGPGGTFQIHAAANGGYYRDAWATDYYVSLPAYIHVLLEITVWSWGGNAWDSSTSVTDVYPASFGGSATQAQADSWSVGRGIWFDAAPGSFKTRSGTITGVMWDT